MKKTDEKNLENGDLFIDENALYQVYNYNQKTNNYQVIKESCDSVQIITMSKTELLDKTYIGHYKE